MSVQGLALFFRRKYASEFTGYLSEDEFASSFPDYSLGVAINSDKVKILKNNLIATYARVNKDMTEQPKLIELNRELAFNPHWKKFIRLVKEFSEKIQPLSLKDIVELSGNFIQELTNFVNSLMLSNSLSRDKLVAIEQVVKNTQDYVHKMNKSILNIHDLKKSPTEEGTWNFGPGKNPAPPPATQKKDKDTLLKRLELENKREEIKKKLGPYATEQAIQEEIQKVISKEKALKKREVDSKFRASLPGKEKNKLGR